VVFIIYEFSSVCKRKVVSYLPLYHVAKLGDF
jgi:hypothetical protein